jgi:hypothetical protein
VHFSWGFVLVFLWHVSTASFNIQEMCCCNHRQWRAYTILLSSFLLNRWCIVDKSIRKNILETCYIWTSAWNDLPIFIIIFLYFKINLYWYFKKSLKIQKRVIRIRISKKNRQHNGLKKCTSYLIQNVCKNGQDIW